VAGQQMRRTVPFLWCALAVATADATAQRPDRRQLERIEQTQRQEGKAIVALADAAMAGLPVPADFPLRWHNDYLKAQQGTFIPFVLTIDASRIAPAALLVYVRAVPRREKPASDAVLYPFEDVYPIETRSESAGALRIIRGFSLDPGEYDVYVVARERVDPAHPALPRRAAVLKQTLPVPNFWSDELTTSSVILADGLGVLREAPSAEDLPERPYAIGLSEIQPAVDTRFRKDEELIVVFLVYNPSVTQEKKFDVEVEYHFFRRTGDAARREAVVESGGRPPERDGEKYFNHTKPQRFTPALMGPLFDPSAGQPVMAGQGVPLAGFPEGEYRLAIKITDMLSGKSITRDVTFSVVPAPDNGVS